MAALWSLFREDAATRLAPPFFSLDEKAAAVAACWYLRAAAAAAAAVLGSMRPAGSPAPAAILSPRRGMGFRAAPIGCAVSGSPPIVIECGVAARDTMAGAAGAGTGADGGTGVCGCAAPGGVPVCAELECTGAAGCDTATPPCCPAAAVIAFTAFWVCDSKVKVLCISMLKKEKTEKQGSKDETCTHGGGGWWWWEDDIRLHTRRVVHHRGNAIVATPLFLPQFCVRSLTIRFLWGPVVLA